MAMDRETGKEIRGVAEIEQSFDTILGTVPGRRFMRYDYGSQLMRMTDVGLSASGKTKLTVATAEAIGRFEPRAQLTQVVYEAAAGAFTCTMHATVKTTRERVEYRRG